MSDDQPPVYVVGDVHGHREPLVDALREQGLVDDEEDWVGGDTELWFVGDFVDRGPDGIGVIDLVMRLQEQAPDQGGRVQALLGNHEILLLGTYRFGDTEVSPGVAGRTFAASWVVNGGQLSDLERLTERHEEWLLGRPLLAHAAGHLLLHSDTLEYFRWGFDVEEINNGVRAVLEGHDAEQWWEVWRRLTTRYAFRGQGGPQAAEQVLSRLGGSRIVHGHSVIADQVGLDPADISGPHLYAGGLVLGIDAGVFAGGPCLVVELPWEG
ncbi:metallophosphoesterase [Haloechinothrix sp. LS1_15]|uniref:metallophosphoesterase n=1 Tax=Haloechinothrix sp. LS1_15 TaxID=2652248 RepID=UPI0029483F15|nr:metallophosphoesterase [Haloechinothrix sp. LS1_15]MDV6014375.1 serine/threonine protein phosphatase [Haloechinothrix sp. LS1_15]